jgi:glycine/D-amino acid oxidase-like deaminating enzyme
MRVVICGGGVIGVCTAYFLARRGIDVSVVERTEVAAAVSGKAGGFLALDWCGSCRPAHEIASDWAYQRMTAYSGTVVSDRDHRRNRSAKLDWLSEGVVITSRLGTPDTTAIVHLRKFTSAIMSAAERNGAQLCPGRVTGMARSADGSTMRGVEADSFVIEADAVVVAMGPWSLLAADWMVLPAVFGQRSPSVVYDTGTDVPPEALFLDYHEEDGSVSTVEVFPRADGTTHVTAFSDIVPLPLDPATVTPGPGRDRSPRGDLRTAVTRVPLGQDHRTASLLPSGDGGWASADR